MANYEYIHEIKKFGRENKIPILLDDTLEYITEILKAIKPKRILEIGTACRIFSNMFFRIFNR